MLRDKPRRAEDNIPGRPCDEEDPDTAVIFYTSGITASQTPFRSLTRIF